MIAEVLRWRQGRHPNHLFMTEVPVPGGVIDVLQISVKAVRPMLALKKAQPLADLEDRELHLLASLPRDRALTEAHLLRIGWTPSGLERARTAGALKRAAGKFSRPLLLPDLFLLLNSFEAKITDPSGLAVQAARRRSFVHRTYIAMPNPKPLKWSPSVLQILELSGVGILDSRTGRTLRSSRPLPPSRWSLFLVARAIARGLNP